MSRGPITRGERVHSSGGQRIVLPVQERRADTIKYGERIYLGNQFWTVTGVRRDSAVWVSLTVQSSTGLEKQIRRKLGQIVPVVR